MLIVGGTGVVGRAIAHDLLRYTPYKVAVASRSESRAKAVAFDLGPRAEHRVVQWGAEGAVRALLEGVSVAVLAAGPYRKMAPSLAAACVRERLSYLDLSDNREFTARVLDLSPEARRARVTLVSGAGLFPGLASVMVRMAAERLDLPEQARVIYAVRGAASSGPASMRTALASIGRPFTMLVDERWQGYTTFDEPETVELPAPFGRTRVYAFEFAGLNTLAATFGLKTVKTKLGVVPDVLNRVGRILGRTLPKPLLTEGAFMNFVVGPAGRLSAWGARKGRGAVAIQVEVEGRKGDENRTERLHVIHPSAVGAAAASAGAAATRLIEGAITEVGAQPPERAIPVERYLAELARRGVHVIVD
ncbi:MAG: saccharopine dehydrogenase NADP-binding domain-containing protein [Myxococcales bacterium]|nr:saccharopine dehydrogenase NADP-binding domain-containing protein [Myxococcales bacterium]